ncbi:MAG: SCO family protein, partial [SAR202 cluster bacterium]|nr:SCO family protein [SAR202 cluster bacterium]
RRWQRWRNACSKGACRRPIRRSSRSLNVRASILGVAFLFAFLLTVASCDRAQEFRGTTLNPPRTAAAISLRDQNGARVSLSDFRGRVVLLTFLYTSCPDICPVVAGHLKQAYTLLEDDAQEVSVVIVSVDPERDTPEAASEYLKRLGMGDTLRYLIGTQEELSPVWASYFVAQAVDRPDGAPGVEDEPQGALDSLAFYTVTHSSPVYVIDGEGMMRSLFTLPMTPQDIVHDVRLLLP